MAMTSRGPHSIVVSVAMALCACSTAPERAAVFDGPRCTPEQYDTSGIESRVIGFRPRPAGLTIPECKGLADDRYGTRYLEACSYHIDTAEFRDLMDLVGLRPRPGAVEERAVRDFLPSVVAELASGPPDGLVSYHRVLGESASVYVDATRANGVVMRPLDLCPPIIDE